MALSQDSIMDMLGFVDEEDRERWAKLEQAKEQRMANKGNGLATQAAQPGLGLAEKVIGAKVYAAQQEHDRGTVRKERTVTTIEESRNVDEDYEPEM